jgi:hypothetical protein
MVIIDQTGVCVCNSDGYDSEKNERISPLYTDESPSIRRKMRYREPKSRRIKGLSH